VSRPWIALPMSPAWARWLRTWGRDLYLTRLFLRATRVEDGHGKLLRRWRRCS
jgi:hypothetical protein